MKRKNSSTDKEKEPKKMKSSIFDSHTFMVYLEPEEKFEIENLILDNGGKISDKNPLIVTSLKYLKTLPKDLYYKHLKHNFFPRSTFDVKHIKELVKKKQKLGRHYQNYIDLFQVNWDSVDDFFEFNEWKKKFNFIDEIPEEEKKKVEEKENDFLLGNDIDSILLSFLSLKDILNLKFINKKTKNFTKNDFVWKNVCENFLKQNSFLVKNKKENINPKNWYLFFRQRIHPFMMQLKEFKNSKKFSTGIKISRKKETNGLKIGSSKIGGSPDLPDDIEIPEYSLLALQLNLEEFQNENFLCWNLPNTGMLYFFVDLPTFDAGLQSCGKLIYYNGDISKLKRKINPAIEFETDEEYDEMLTFPISRHLLFESEIKLFENVVVETNDKHVPLEETHNLLDWDEGETKPEFPFILHASHIQDTKGYQKIFQIMLPYPACGCDYMFYEFYMPNESMNDLNDEKTWEKFKMRIKLYSI